eukprot:m.32755 g.32755  ORF g.32755 m.32755 type:complete len:498 (+) comp16692_c0_seq1:164-1657(+)
MSSLKFELLCDSRVFLALSLAFLGGCGCMPSNHVTEISVGFVCLFGCLHFRIFFLKLVLVHVGYHIRIGCCHLHPISIDNLFPLFSGWHSSSHIVDVLRAHHPASHCRFLRQHFVQGLIRSVIHGVFNLSPFSQLKRIVARGVDAGDGGDPRRCFTRVATRSHSAFTVFHLRLLALGILVLFFVFLLTACFLFAGELTPNLFRDFLRHLSDLRLSFIFFFVAEHVTIQRPSVFIYRGLPPATSVVTKFSTLRDLRVKAGDLEVGVRRRGAVTLHVQQPRGWDGGRILANRHPQRRSEFVRELSGLLVHRRRLKLFAFIIQFAVDAHFRFRLVTEERVVEFLVIDVNLTHLWPSLLALFGFKTHPLLLLRQGLSHVHDACVDDVVGELKRWFFNSPLSLEILSLLSPVLWDRNSISCRLQENKQLRVGGGDVMNLHNVGSLHELFQLRHCETVEFAQFLLRHGRGFFLLFHIFIVSVGVGCLNIFGSFFFSLVLNDLD